MYKSPLLCFILSPPYTGSPLNTLKHHQLIPINYGTTCTSPGLAPTIISFTRFGKCSHAQCLSSFWSILSLPCAHQGVPCSIPLPWHCCKMFTNIQLTGTFSIFSSILILLILCIEFDTCLFLSLSFTN